MPRVVKGREELEGEIFESLVLVDGKDLPVAPGGTEFTEIGRSRRRVRPVHDRCSPLGMAEAHR